MQAQQGLLIFAVALLCAHTLPVVNSYHPFTLFGLIFKSVAKRVYQPTHTRGYQYLSGILAFSLPIITLLALVLGLSIFAFHPQWLGGLALYLCLDTQTVNRTKRIATLLNQNQKAAARQLLSTIVVREVDTLSSIGIVKACIDSTALRTIRHYYLIILFYLIAGPIVALTYKLLLLCNHAWRAELKPDSAFIKPLSKLLYILEWLPIRGFVIVMALSLHFKKVRHYLRHYAQFFYQTNSGWILCLFAANLHVQLGGPCLYHGERFTKMRIGSERHPEVKDLILFFELLKRIQIFSGLLLLLIWVLSLITIQLLSIK
jgi:adenosylcobinamide-phosphate synthase